MLAELILTFRLVLMLHAEGHPYEDAGVFARACVRAETPHVSAETLCAVAYVESKHRFRAVNAGGFCGAWQQHPQWSQMWGDDCWEGNERLCRQPGGEGVSCAELLDVNLAARVAARHLTYLTQRHGERALCRYAGATGERCTRYTTAVARAERLIRREE